MQKQASHYKVYRWRIDWHSSEGLSTPKKAKVAIGHEHGLPQWITRVCYFFYISPAFSTYFVTYIKADDTPFFTYDPTIPFPFTKASLVICLLSMTESIIQGQAVCRACWYSHPSGGSETSPTAASTWPKFHDRYYEAATPSAGQCSRSVFHFSPDTRHIREFAKTT